MIDTHAHIYDTAFDNDRDASLQRALDAGVEKIFLPNCDSSTIAPMMDLVAAHPHRCFPMIGLHPCYVKENFEEELSVVERWLGQTRFAAVGEIGLDYYWDKTFVEQQKEAFSRQVIWARQRGLPIVIHSRESTADCIEMVRASQDGTLRGIFHCFSGTKEEAQEIVSLGFLLGIGGVVTYKNAGVLHEVVQNAPLENLVLETDAPYLSPVPHRGKRNEPAYTSFVAQKIAELRGVDVIEIDRITTANAERLFCAT